MADKVFTITKYERPFIGNGGRSSGEAATTMWQRNTRTQPAGWRECTQYARGFECECALLTLIAVAEKSEQRK